MKKKNFKENNSAFIKLWTASLCWLTSDFALLFFRRTSWLARVTCSIWWIPFLHSSCQVWRDRWRWGNSFSRIGKMSSSSLMVTGKSKLHVLYKTEKKNIQYLWNQPSLVHFLFHFSDLQFNDFRGGVFWIIKMF